MLCSYRSSYLDLSVALVGFQMKGCELRLRHICQREYVAMYEIDLDRMVLKICCNCVDKIWMGGKSEKWNKVKHSTV